MSLHGSFYALPRSTLREKDGGDDEDDDNDEVEEDDSDEEDDCDADGCDDAEAIMVVTVLVMTVVVTAVVMVRYFRPDADGFTIFDYDNVGLDARVRALSLQHSHHLRGAVRGVRF